jgi:hypothetical protein
MRVPFFAINQPLLLHFIICRYIRDSPVNSSTYNSARIAAGTAARVAVAVATKQALNGAAIGRSSHTLSTNT